MRYLYRVLPNTFIGGMLGFDYTKGTKFSDLSYITFDGVQQKTGYTATGIGAIIEYDSRDFIPNPFRGIYISLVETFYPKPMGNCGQSLWRTNFTADFYQRVWRDGILAIDLYGEFNSDGTPWPMLARMGGSQRMRGYYEGQYTDNGMITFQVELRQRIWRASAARCGAVPATSSTASRPSTGRRRCPTTASACAGNLKTYERTPRLRLRPQDERLHAQHQRGVLNETNHGHNDRR